MRKNLIFLCLAAFIAPSFYNNAFAQKISEVLSQRFERYQSAAQQERVLIINDRDIYAPGEFIWLSACVYDVLKTKTSSQSERVRVRLLNSELSEILYKDIAVRNGFGDGFVVLPKNLSDGLYFLTGSTDKSGRESFYYRQKIIVRNKIVPPFVVEASFPDRRFAPGDEFPFSILFKDYYNEPIKNMPFQLNIYDGRSMIQSIPGKQKKGGETLMMKIPETLESGILTYKIIADNNKGKKAENMGVIPVVSDELFINFYPENGHLVDGLSTIVNCFVYDASCVPLEVEANLISDDEMLITIKTDMNGFASFNMTPTFGQKNYLQIKKPVLVEAEFALPDVRKEGFTVSLQAREDYTLNYRIQNGYEGERVVFLVGISENEIFSTTELKFEGETTTAIDISNAHGSVGYFVLVNTDANIEAEHVVLLKPTKTTPPTLRLSEEIARPRSIVELDFANPGTSGMLVVTAVNGAWKADQLYNPPVSNLSLPFDLSHTIMMRHISERGDSDIEKYISTYEPRLFGWDRVLNTVGTFSRHNLPESIRMNRIIYDEVSAQGMVERSDGQISISNVLSISGFAVANPKYIYDLYKVETKTKPPYKTLLENGTPIMEVLKTIKPYNMYGNKIVFQGSANSLLAQDGALIIIDGISRGTDATVLNALNPYDIDKINISTNPTDIQRYTGLNSVGIIEIETKKGSGFIEKVPETISDDQQFESPNYAKKGETKSIDWRSTLYWKVEKKEGDGGPFGLTYFNADFITNVVGSAVFIPVIGPPQSGTFEYEIK